MKVEKPAALFMTIDGLTDPLGQSQVLPYLVGLSNSYDITIISFEKEENYKKNKSIIEEIVQKHQINWEWNSFKSGIPIYSQFSNFFALYKTAKKVSKEKDLKIIHARSLVPAIIGSRLKKTIHAKLLFDMRGFWADERVEGKIWSLQNPIFKRIYKYFKKQEAILMESADHLITLTENAKRFIQENYPKAPPIEVIPCCVNTEKFYFPRDVNKGKELKRSLKINESAFVLLYLGSLGTRYKLNEMFAFFKELKQLNNEAIFLIVSRTDTEYIHQKAREEEVEVDDLIITHAASTEVPDYISLANASIFFIETGYTSKAVSPTKKAEALIMGKPIVANSGIGDTDEFILNNELGVLIKDYSKESLKEGAKSLLEANFKADKLRNFALENLSLQRALTSYSGVYHKLLS